MNLASACCSFAYSSLSYFFSLLGRPESLTVGLICFQRFAFSMSFVKLFKSSNFFSSNSYFSTTYGLHLEEYAWNLVRYTKSATTSLKVGISVAFIPSISKSNSSDFKFLVIRFLYFYATFVAAITPNLFFASTSAFSLTP